METLHPDDERLIAAAEEVRRRAYAPYSGYAVGAALLAKNAQGEEVVFSGCNVENASYGATRCAEQSAVLAAVSAGVRDFEAIAVVAGGSEPPAPCGLCRQILSEFAPRLRVIMAHVDGRRRTARLDELFPQPFGAATLHDRVAAARREEGK